MSTPLDDYVNKPDASFSYHHIEGAQQKGPGFTIEFLNMTSQTWLDARSVLQVLRGSAFDSH